MKAKRIVFFPVLGLAVSLLIVACEGQAPEPTQLTEHPTTVQETETSMQATEVQPIDTQADQEPVTLRVGWTEAVDCFNPFGCGFIWRWGDLVYDMLVGKGSNPDCDGSATRILDKWEVSSDGLVWTLTLADNASFADGTPLTAQGLADYLEWFSTTQSLKWFPITWSFDSVNVLDDHTITITTQMPNPRFAESEAKFWYVMPMEIWSTVPEDQIYSFEAYPPDGTGPYKLVEYEAGSHMILEARPDYHRGKPSIDRIVVQFYATTDAVTNALLAGEIDMTPPYMPPETYDTLVADSGISVYEQLSARKYVLIFNLSKDGQKNHAVEDPAFREAVDYAIDKQALLNIVLLGHGSVCPTNWACAPNMPSEINPDLVVTLFDPEHAKEILEAAGYKDSNGDGAREDPSGNPLNLRLYFQTEESQQMAMAQLVADYLTGVGISIRVEALEKGQLWETGLSTRDFDLILMNQYTDVNAPTQWNYNFSCGAAEGGTSAGNFSGYCDEEADQWINKANEAFTEADYQAAIFQAEVLLSQDRPNIVLVAANKIQAYRNDRFQFPSQICVEPENALLSFEGVMNANPR